MWPYAYARQWRFVSFRHNLDIDRRSTQRVFRLHFRVCLAKA